MASLEDYDEFGNYIGADLESEEEEEMEQAQFVPQPSGATAPLEGYEDEQMQEPENNMALMEVDGTITCMVLKRCISS
jgi:U5 small nuclear ribonucleoprotein component